MWLLPKLSVFRRSRATIILNRHRSFASSNHPRRSAPAVDPARQVTAKAAAAITMFLNRLLLAMLATRRTGRCQCGWAILGFNVSTAVVLPPGDADQQTKKAHRRFSRRCRWPPPVFAGHSLGVRSRRRVDGVVCSRSMPLPARSSRAATFCPNRCCVCGPALAILVISVDDREALHHQPESGLVASTPCLPCCVLKWNTQRQPAMARPFASCWWRVHAG